VPAGSRLRDDEAVGRLLFESAQDAIFVMEGERFVDCNTATLRLFGCQMAEIIGQTPMRFSPPLQSDGRCSTVAARTKIAAAIDGVPQRFEWRHCQLDGTEFEAEVSLNHAELDGRSLILATVRDVSARKQAEGALASAERRFHELHNSLRESEGLFRALSEMAPIGIFLTDVRGDITYLNEQLKGILRMREFSGRVLDIVHPDDRALVQTARENPGTDQEREFRLLLDGEVRWIRVRGRPLFDGGGALIGSIGAAEDITDLKRATAERERLLEALRDADRRKDEFLAILSHELRNPLAPIHNSLDILDQATPGGEQASRALAVIDRQVSHLSRLVDDLLDVTRIGQGKVRVRPERVQLAELVRRTIDDHRPLFAESALVVALGELPADAWVWGDRLRLAQVIGNLLQNAAKFTPAGGQVSVTMVVEDGERLLLTVADTGAGIDPDILPRLFEPFTQADSTLDRSRGGLGLGLALVKGLVEEHGGAVTASSAGPGQGAAFAIRLPLHRGRAPARNEGARSPRRVLIIEDNADAAECLREALRLDGHTVAVAGSGVEGIAMARSFRPDAVLCDIGLPGMDGYEVARRVRADTELTGIMLIAVTGYARAEDHVRAREAGFDHHLAKPASVAAIRDLIREP
jgi:PAS domain S-box-containing protein